mmetsp:Transcript_54071/g.132569  ORF Transcript_54071/g.132569 Transcript_54071/m.132569 type:complete len:305 (-) Transcript_54071:180-1094(-)
MEKLVRALEKKNKQHVLEYYRPGHIRAEVAKFGARRITKCLLEGEDCYNQTVRNLEVALNREVFMRYWQCGSHLVQGFDKENRPLMWINEGLYPSWPNKVTYIMLYSWAGRLALRSRPEGVTHVHGIYFERDRKPLAFNVDFAMKMMSICSTVCFPDASVGAFSVVCAGWGAKTIYGATKHLPPANALPVRFVNTIADLKEIVQDPKDIPSYVQGGRTSSSPYNAGKRSTYCQQYMFDIESRWKFADVLKGHENFYDNAPEKPSLSQKKEQLEQIAEDDEECFSSSDYGAGSFVKAAPWQEELG